MNTSVKMRCAGLITTFPEPFAKMSSSRLSTLLLLIVAASVGALQLPARACTPALGAARAARSALPLTVMQEDAATKGTWNTAIDEAGCVRASILNPLGRHRARVASILVL